MAGVPSDLATAKNGPERESHPVFKGIALGLANLLVIAIGIAAGNDVGAIPYVMLFGGIPAIVVGGVLGTLAGVTATSSWRWRTVLLLFPALGALAVLGEFFGFARAVPLACIPTLIAAFVLERWTRQVVSPPVAAARVLRT